ncbi:unnamed protein product [Prunus armeniaca]
MSSSPSSSHITLLLSQPTTTTTRRARNPANFYSIPATKFVDPVFFKTPIYCRCVVGRGPGLGAPFGPKMFSMSFPSTMVCSDLNLVTV